MENNFLAHFLKAMREAGEALLSLQKNEIAIQKKSNNDLVTNGDLLVNDILKDQLLNPFPDFGWLSEENIDDDTRLNRQKIWIIDPIDGTKEFAQGIPEYAISVALVENGQPVLASVYNPASNEFFYAIKNQGAWLNDKPISCSTNSHPVFLASRTEYTRGKWSAFEKYSAVKPVGSIAYKLALVAAGKADAALSLGNKNEWDIAAGMLLVTEAGGKVTDAERKPILLNQPNTLVKGIVAAASVCQDEVFEIIARST